MSKTTARDHSRRTLGPPTWPFPIPGAVLGVQNLNKTKLQNNTRKSRDMDCRSSKKSAAMDFPQCLGFRVSKTVLVERCWKKSNETADGVGRKVTKQQNSTLICLALGPKTEKHKKRCAEKERNTLRTKAQTRSPKKRRLRNTTGRSFLGRAQGRLFPTVAPWKISARKIKKSQEKAVQHSNWLQPPTGGHPWTATGGSVFVPLVY